MREESANQMIHLILQELRDVPLEDRQRFIADRCGANTQLHDFVRDLTAFLSSSELEEFEPQVTLIADEAAEALIGKTLSGYTIRQHIATGGLAYVFLGTSSLRDPHIAAVKMARVARYADALSRFDEEVRVLQRMKHPYIASFIDSGATPHGSPYLVVEFVFGKPLLDFCDDRELTIQQRVELFVKVIDAIAYAHEEHGIAHRDIHPGNILVERNGTPKLVDFGIARVANGNAASGVFTRSTMTLPYASPEQTRLEETTLSTDVFSAGVVLYQLLTGHHPFDARTPDQLREQIELHDALVPSKQVLTTTRVQRDDGSDAEIVPEVVSRNRRSSPAAVARTLRGSLDAIVLKAMRKDAPQRYATAREFAEDLRSYLRQRPIIARPAGKWASFGLLVRRHPVATLAVAATIVVLVVASAILLFHSITIRRERDRLQTVATFLQDTLKSQDAGEHDVSVRSILDGARRRLEGQVLADAETHASMLTTLGTSYQSIGDYRTAETMFRKALSMRSAGDPLLHAEALNNVATVELQLGDAVTSERDVRAAIAMRRKAGRGDDPMMSDLVGNLGLAVQARGDLVTAERLFKETMSMPAGEGVDARRRLIERRNNLATVWYYMGRFREAFPLFKQNAAETAGLFGATTIKAAMAIKNLASCEAGLERYDDAERHFGEAIAIQRRVSGESSPDVALTLNDLALTLAEANRDAAAEPLYRESLRIRESVLGVEHPDVGVTLNNYGITLNTLGRYTDAAAAYERAFRITVKAHGDAHPDVAMILANWGKSLMNAGQPRRAESILRDALRRDRANLALSKLDLAASVLSVAQVERKLGRYDQAEVRAREALQLLGSAELPLDHWRFGDAYFELGQALVGGQRYGEALEMIDAQSARFVGDREQAQEFALLRRRANSGK